MKHFFLITLMYLSGIQLSNTAQAAEADPTLATAAQDDFLLRQNPVPQRKVMTAEAVKAHHSHLKAEGKVEEGFDYRAAVEDILFF